MLLRNQRYAAQIFEQVSQVPEAERQKYGSMAHKLPALIRTAGLAQSLAFADSRNITEHEKLLDHIAQVVGLTGRESLMRHSREARQLTEYMHLTRKVLSALTWYKRFAQSVLKVESSDKSDDDTEGENA